MPVQIVVPNMGESVVEATIASWLKSAGDTVSAGEEIVELETDKVNQAIQAESDGVLTEILKQVGDTVSVGDVLAVLGDAGATVIATVASTPPAIEPTAAPTAAEAHTATSTPLAKTVAEREKVDLSTVTGTGTGGRITAGDVTNKLAPATAPVVPPVVTPVAKPAPAVTPNTRERGNPAQNPTPSPSGRPEERIRMTRRRKTIAANLMQATQNTAMLTTFNEVDMTAIMELRKRRKESFEKQFGVGLGFMSFFTKAVIGALKQFPYLNAEIQGDDIVLKKYYDIGIAVGVEEGLVVPVVRDADTLSFAGIEKKIKEVAGKAQAGTLGISDLTGGTFTITNGGVYGSLMSTPILNYPQVGILGMHTIQQRVIVVNNEMAIRPMMYIALSYDHRIVDGGTAVRFLVKVKQLVEDPETLLLEG